MGSNTKGVVISVSWFSLFHFNIFAIHVKFKPYCIIAKGILPHFLFEYLHVIRATLFERLNITLQLNKMAILMSCLVSLPVANGWPYNNISLASGASVTGKQRQLQTCNVTTCRLLKVNPFEFFKSICCWYSEDIFTKTGRPCEMHLSSLYCLLALRCRSFLSVCPYSTVCNIYLILIYIFLNINLWLDKAHCYICVSLCPK